MPPPRFAVSGKTATFAETAEIMNQEIIRFVKYGFVGVLNTAITFFSFMALRAADCNLDAANFISFALGMCNSFALNKVWVFRRRGTRWLTEAAWFLGGALLCWGLQWLVFRGALLLWSEWWAQLVGMAAYTVFNYLFNRFVTFRRRS